MKIRNKFTFFIGILFFFIGLRIWWVVSDSLFSIKVMDATPQWAAFNVLALIFGTAFMMSGITTISFEVKRK
jgi:hypothetical protein